MIDALRARIGNLPFVTLREVEGQLCLVERKTSFTFTPDPDAEFTLLARFEDSHAAHLTAAIASKDLYGVDVLGHLDDSQQLTVHPNTLKYRLRRTLLLATTTPTAAVKRITVNGNPTPGNPEKYQRPPH